MGKNNIDEHLETAIINAADKLAHDLDVTNETQFEEIKPREDLYERIMTECNKDKEAQNKKRFRKRVFFRMLVATVTFVILLTLSVTAFRVNFTEAVMELYNSAYQYLENNFINTNSKSNIEQTYSQLINAKQDLKFECAVPGYLPKGMKFENFEVQNKGKRLRLDYKGNEMRLIIRQEYAPYEGAKGNSLDINNSKYEEIEIMGQKVRLFFIERSDNKNASTVISWRTDNIYYMTDSNLKKNVILNIIKSLKKLN